MKAMNTRNSASFVAAVTLLVFAGCQSGMYSSDVSVEKREGGISDYTVVETLPVGDLPAAMPVVVESSPVFENKKDLYDLLWGLTLGAVPAFTLEASKYEVLVKTPLGEKSGTFTVEACSWFGWLPIFLPYPGIADERVADPKLPNVTLMTKAKDRLVANLVSQFPKEQYERFHVKYNKEAAERARVAKERAEAERVRLAKEAAERARVAKERAEAERVRLAKEAAERAERARLALHSNIVANVVKRDLAQIKCYYERGWYYPNPYRKGGGDWLAHWSSPRLELTESDALAGEAILSEFGTKYLPNAYANYEKRREELFEIQQMFNEVFPQPWTIREASPEWNAFNNLLERFAKARAEAFLCHDELCHYWCLWRFGVLADHDFAAVDKQALSVAVSENVKRAGVESVPLKPVEGNVLDFAAKYAPLSNSVYQKMAHAFKEVDALLSEVSRQRRQMDDVCLSRAFVAAAAKRNALACVLNALSFQLQTWCVEHRTTVKSSDDVARCDADMAGRLKPFLDFLPCFVKERTLGPVIADAGLVAIQGKRWRMQRTEVTQLQWMLVMGSNPSTHPGLDCPVENVSWADCQEFIRRASAMDGRRYRLPMADEWEYACRAGSKDDWGKRANGVCGPLDMMGWYSDNSGGKTHPVAQKEPNAWGLYDMHGNVSEWCARGGCRGGSFSDSARECSASYSSGRYYPRSYIGFRLVAQED